MKTNNNSYILSQQTTIKPIIYLLRLKISIKFIKNFYEIENLRIARHENSS